MSHVASVQGAHALVFRSFAFKRGVLEGARELGATLPCRAVQVAAAVDGDAQQPGFQVLVVFEVGRVLQEAQKHLLADVVGVVRRLGLVEREAIHGGSPRAQGVLDEIVRPQVRVHAGYRLLTTNTAQGVPMCPECEKSDEKKKRRNGLDCRFAASRAPIGATC